jgi:hypothetical protein
MSVVDRSRDHVEDLLADLEEGFESFPVTQTTVSVPSSGYERLAERCREGIARVAVHVHNDSGEVLLVEGDDGLVVPGTSITAEESVEGSAREAVTQLGGIDCRIEEIQEVTIAGVHDEHDPDREPVYRLVVLVSASQTGGSPAAGSCWSSDPPETEILV